MPLLLSQERLGQAPCPVSTLLLMGFPGGLQMAYYCDMSLAFSLSPLNLTHARLRAAGCFSRNQQIFSSLNPSHCMNPDVASLTRSIIAVTQNSQSCLVRTPQSLSPGPTESKAKQATRKDILPLLHHNQMPASCQLITVLKSGIRDGFPLLLLLVAAATCPKHKQFCLASTSPPVALHSVIKTKAPGFRIYEGGML